MSLISIYQVIPRLFGNKIENPVFNGTREQNGVGKMNNFTPAILQRIKDLGFTHIWYTGLIEHARCTSDSEWGLNGQNPSIVKGKAGSPYAITDYYDIDPDLADSIPDRMKEFDNLVIRTHQQGLKFIIDFVPNHVARQYASDVYPDKDFGRNDDVSKAFSPLNDFYYIPGEELHLPKNSGTQVEETNFELYHEFPAKATGNSQFSAWPNMNDWYETIKLNYGVDFVDNRSAHFEPHPPLWQKMVDILTYWAGKGVDAFRCDMAEMVPVEFWKFAIRKVTAQFPTVVFIAEVYNPAQYHDYLIQGGFHYLYDKVGLYDTLRSITCCDAPAYLLTQSWQKLGGIDQQMLRFLENHDEQRIASKYFAGDAFRAIPALIVTATINQGAVMVYFGQEVGEPATGASGYSGEDGRTTIFDYYNVPAFQRWYNNGIADGVKLTDEEKHLRGFYQSLLNLVINEKAFTDGSFYDLMWANNQYGGPDYQKIYAYIRYAGKEIMLVLVNFDKIPHGFLFKIPAHAWEQMEIIPDKMVYLQPVLGTAPSLSFDAKHMDESGFWLNIEAMNGIIFRLKTES